MRVCAHEHACVLRACVRVRARPCVAGVLCLRVVRRVTARARPLARLRSKAAVDAATAPLLARIAALEARLDAIGVRGSEITPSAVNFTGGWSLRAEGPHMVLRETLAPRDTRKAFLAGKYADM